jgi:ABC-2 type transport system ATP-binding protein
VIVRSPDIARLWPALERAGASVASEPDGSFAVRSLAIEEVGRIAAGQAAILHELRRRTSTLEDAFLALTGGTASPPARPDAPAASP